MNQSLENPAMLASRISVTRAPSSAFLSGIAAGGMALAAHAGTITVCPDGSCDFTDPAAAVDAAVTGDVVEIAAGTYPLAATISAYGKNITIRGAVDSQGRPATVLDGQGARNVLVGLSITSEARFENLVITNGRADYGGGVFLSGASPVFRNCHLRGNVARFRGGAILNSASASPTLIDCEISGNSAGSTQSPAQGTAGAVSVGDGTVTLIRCIVRANSSDLAGGAFILQGSSTLILQSTRVCGNSAPNGAQIHLNGGGGTVTYGAGACVSTDCDDCPVTPACGADLNDDGSVNGDDLGRMLAAWGPCTSCSPDLDGNGFVDGQDLGRLLADWGACGG